MNERILQTLEFDKIINRLTNQSSTSIVKDLALQLKPSADIAKVREMQAETDEASEILRLNLDVPLGGITDIRASIKRSVIGGVLTAEECLDVANTLYGGRQVKHFLEKMEADLPILKELAGNIVKLRRLDT